MSKVPMTRQGWEKLRAELKQLKSIERPKVIEEIATARAHGDLSENAEYDAAKEKQAFLEGRIKEVEDKVRAVTPENIMNLAQDIFRDDSVALTLLGPVGEEGSYETKLNF